MHFESSESLLEGKEGVATACRFHGYRLLGCMSALVVMVYLVLLAVAAVVSIRVDLEIIENAAEAEAVLSKMQALFSILHAVACGNSTLGILSPQDCSLLS